MPIAAPRPYTLQDAAAAQPVQRSQSPDNAPSDKRALIMTVLAVVLGVAWGVCAPLAWLYAPGIVGLVVLAAPLVALAIWLRGTHTVDETPYQSSPYEGL